MGRLRDLALGVTQLLHRKQLYTWLLAASAALDAQGDALGPFNTIAVGAADSGRLIDVSLETLTALDAGTAVWILSVKDLFRWDPTSTLTADNITVCAPSSLGGGAGRFIRECIAAPEWTTKATFTAWAIDPNNGSDENLGDTTHPLKTDAERQRRWGAGATLPAGAWSITWLASNSASDLFNLDVVLGHSATLTVQGKFTVSASGTVTAFAAVNRGGQTFVAVTDAAQTWTTQVRRWATITSGPRVGTYFNVTKDLGSHQCRSSTPETFSTSTGLATRVALQVGDPYEVHTVPGILVGLLDVRLAETTPLGAWLLFDSIELDLHGTAIMHTTGVPVFATRATLTNAFGVESDFFSVSGIAFTQTCVLLAGTNCTSLGGVNFGTLVVDSGANAIFDLDFLLQGNSSTNGKVIVNPGGAVQVGTFAAFDVPAEGALTIEPGATVISGAEFDGADLIWGDGNTGRAVKVFAGGTLAYTTKPTINTPQGAGRQSIIGGTATDWAAVPFFNAGNGAAIVVNQ